MIVQVRDLFEKWRMENGEWRMKLSCKHRHFSLSILHFPLVPIVPVLSTPIKNPPLTPSGVFSYNGCAVFARLWLKVDASRRRNDPRNPGKIPVSMVRLRCKSCQSKISSESCSSGEAIALGANQPAGECGVKDQVRREDRFFIIQLAISS